MADLRSPVAASPDPLAQVRVCARGTLFKVERDGLCPDSVATPGLIGPLRATQGLDQLGRPLGGHAHTQLKVANLDLARSRVAPWRRGEVG